MIEESCPNKLTYGSNLIISSIDVSNHHTSPPRVCIRLMTASASCLIPWLPFQHNAIKRSINIQKTKEHNPSVSVNLENNWLINTEKDNGTPRNQLSDSSHCRATDHTTNPSTVNTITSLSPNPNHWTQNERRWNLRHDR
jgi:hypothetical protein